MNKTVDKYVYKFTEKQMNEILFALNGRRVKKSVITKLLQAGKGGEL